ncbi:trehalose-phosphatase [Gordonia sp. NPDC003425]
MSANGIPSELRDALVRAAAVPQLLLASDYDGCIAPIVSRPQDARPNPASIEAISAAGSIPDTAAAVISGRARVDLGKLSGLTDAPVTLVGSHGSEFDGGFADAITDAQKELLDAVIDSFETIAADHPGVTVETKPVSAALHVRNAAPDVADDALGLARSGPATWSGVYATEGKAVIELAVIETSKGHALDLLRERFGSDAIIYLGDDVTDEKAFAHLPADPDVSIKVGDGDTAARYRIADTDDVASVLEFTVARRREWLADNR